MPIFQHPISPLAEQNAALRFNPITYRKNNIKIVIFCVTCDHTTSFLLNCRKICDSCNSLQLFRQRTQCGSGSITLFEDLHPFVQQQFPVGDVFDFPVLVHNKLGAGFHLENAVLAYLQQRLLRNFKAAS